MNPFETETMADLCLRQGHRAEALAIFRRLLDRTSDEDARARIGRRIVAVENSDTAPADSPLPAPGVRTSGSGDRLTVEWRLPVEIQRPALEVLLVKNGPEGVVTETRAIAVDGNTGQLTLGTRGLHSARVAIGSHGPQGFVPLAVARHR